MKIVMRKPVFRLYTNHPVELQRLAGGLKLQIKKLQMLLLLPQVYNSFYGEKTKKSNTHTICEQPCHTICNSK